MGRDLFWVDICLRTICVQGQNIISYQGNTKKTSMRFLDTHEHFYNQKEEQ